MFRKTLNQVRREASARTRGGDGTWQVLAALARASCPESPQAYVVKLETRIVWGVCGVPGFCSSAPGNQH